MRFYGNGIVKLGSKSLRFSKPEKRYERGFLDTEDPNEISSLLDLGYENDGKPEEIVIDAEPDIVEEPESEIKDEVIEEPDERFILADKAESLGIKVKGNWGVKKLTEEIELAMSEPDEIIGENEDEDGES